MQMLGKYVAGLTAAALISGILLSLFPKGRIRCLMQLICGLFLSVTALSPVMDFTIPDLSEFTSEYLSAGQSYSQLGENNAREETHQRIKDMLEAYILDKAAAEQAEITADVALSPEGFPESVTLTGYLPERVQQKLEEMIAKDLGIPKENQQWIW